MVKLNSVPTPRAKGLTFLSLEEMKNRPPPAIEPPRAKDVNKQSHASSNGRTNKRPAKSPSPPPQGTRAQASPARASVPPKSPVLPAAPAKFSYAAALGSKNGSSAQQQQRQPQQQQQHQRQQEQRQQEQQPHADAMDGHDSYDDYESDGHSIPSEPEVFVPMFSIRSPSLQCYQNILYWGRSNHGCVNLTNL